MTKKPQRPNQQNRSNVIVDLDNPAVSPEAELPRIYDSVDSDQTYAAGFTPTKTGEWVVPMLVKTEQVQ